MLKNGMIGERLRVGDIVKHFKRETVVDKTSNDYLYKITDIAKNTETGELMVIYQALYRSTKAGITFDSFARPYDMFIAEVDHQKYPDIKQQYRFEIFR